MLCARYSTAMMKWRHRTSALVLAFFLAPLPLHADHAVNINTADQAALTTLTGIGTVKATAIIDYRGANGPFTAKEDIQNVSGIGPATYEGIKDHITVSGGQATPEPSPEEVLPAPPPSGGSPAIEPQIVAYAGNDRTVITGADVAIAGKAFTKDGEPLGPTGVRFLWNFGDGMTADGPTVMHRWVHPGRYVVTLDVSASKNTASHRMIVTAKAAEFGLATLSDGSAVVENKGSGELNVSFWHIRYGNDMFTLPEDTIVLAQEKIIIPPASLKFAVADGWMLLYPNGAVAQTAAPAKPVIIHAPADTAPARAPVSRASTAIEETNEKEPAKPKEETVTKNTAAVTAVVSVNANEGSKGALMSGWTIGLIALTSIGAAGAFFASRAGRKDWQIIED